jgi:hypothetical protein
MTMDAVPARTKRVSESARPTAGALPRSGDVVVVREKHSAVRYTIRQLPATVQQLGASSRDEAIRLARGFAQRHGVDLWHSEDGTYRLLEAYRLSISRSRS